MLGENNELKNRDLLVTVSPDDPVNELVNDTVNEPVKITATQQNVLKTIKENTDFTVLQIATRVGISIATVKRAISVLKSAGLIERVGSDKTGHWVVK